MSGLSHKNETARLAKLREFEILDTPPERAFDRIAGMAARVFRVEMAAITLVDEYRTWCKASYGLRGIKEVFRETSLCNYTILSKEVLVVPDATHDPRFAYFPEVTGDPGMRFYAGAPLTTPEGHRLGALCVLSNEKRSFTRSDRMILADLASVVVDEMILRRIAGSLRTEVTGRKHHERTLAKQHRLLQRLSGSLEDGIRQRTTELTRANASLNAEIARREHSELERFNLFRLIEESPDFIGLASVEGVPRYLNQAGCRLIGLENLEQAGQTTILDHFCPEDRGFVTETVLPTLRQAGHWEGDVHIRHFKGKPSVPVSLNIFYVRDPGTGKPVSLAAIARDITQQQRANAALRESEERFRHLVEQAGDAIFVCDLDATIIDVNQEACDSLGYRREELLGLPLQTVETTFDPAEALPRWRAWRPGLAANMRGIHRRKDGTTFPVESRMSSFQTDGHRYMLALVRDVTERHRAEVALKQAKEEAETANRAKSEFLSRMSHELRTPLNAILGFGQILLNQAANTTQKDCAGQVVHAGNHLLDLINEVLDIARIEAGRVELSVEPIRVENLVAETLDLVRPQAQARRIVFEVNLGGYGGHHLRGDRQRCKQVLLNLFSNALKYTPDEGRVRIECGAVRPGQMRVGVTDTGPGIAADKLARLFVPFDRLGAERSAIPGTGLGLTLSKHLIEAMGGSIGVRSAPGEGSTFWLQLPRHRGPVPPGIPALLPMLAGRPREAAVPVVAAEAEVCTVLYVEDNASNIRLIEHLFSGLGRVQLLTARSGKEGLALARHHRPSVILLDLHLPDLPGWEVLARLQSSKHTCQIPVVAVSADATPGTVERLINAGARAYLTKPLNIKNFYELLPRLGLHTARGPARVSEPS